MITLNLAQQAAVQADGTTLARIIALVLTNGVSVYYTDCDTKLIIDGNTYVSDPGVLVSAIEKVLGTAATSLSIDIGFADDGITKTIVEAGLLDNADVTVSIVDWANEVTVDPILYYRGKCKKAVYKGANYATLDIEPILSNDFTLAQDKLSITCRADLGDAKCTVDIDALKKTFTVVAVTNRQVFTTNLTDADGAFDYGMVLFTSGLNNDASTEVATYAHTSGQVTLRLVTPYVLAPGDTGTIYPGCSKIVDDAQGGCLKYANVVNFQGEPFVVAQSTANVAVSSTPQIVSPIVSDFTQPPFDPSPPGAIIYVKN